MKKTIIILICLFASFLSSAKNNDGIKWLEKPTYISTIPKAVIYEFDNGNKNYSYSHVFNSDERFTIPYKTFDSKIIKKSIELKAVGYANLSRSLEYDTYIVEFKERLYYLHCENVLDNTMMNKANSLLWKEYKRRISRYESAKKELDSLVSIYMPISERKYKFYSGLSSKLPQKIDSVKANVRTGYDICYKIEYDKWYDKLPLSTKTAFSKIEITYSNLKSPNSVGGCDYIFYYKNKTNKTIKYCRIYGTFYNAVHDVVRCDITGTSSFSGTETGPILPDATGGGIWECVIYNWAAEYIKLSNLHITFTDGSSLSISGGDIKRMLDWVDIQDEFNDRYGSLYDKEREAVDRINREYARYQRLAKLWKERFDFLSSSKFPRPKEYEDDECEEILDVVKDLYYRRPHLKNAIKSFEIDNMIDEPYITE